VKSEKFDPALEAKDLLKRYSFQYWKL